MTRRLTDPPWPLVVCMLEGVRASVDNVAEAAVVARVASSLREALIDPTTGETYEETEEGDRRFWNDGLFVVSPHHAQIRAIKAALAKERRWRSEPFVDTVDKRQGQECQAVIVSYGVSDRETALAEAEFIYSLNRLNVAVTRAKAKCIVFLSQALLEPSFDLLSNEAAARGLGHMHALVAFCRLNGVPRTVTSRPRLHGAPKLCANKQGLQADDLIAECDSRWSPRDRRRRPDAAPVLPRTQEVVSPSNDLEQLHLDSRPGGSPACTAEPQHKTPRALAASRRFTSAGSRQSVRATSTSCVWTRSSRKRKWWSCPMRPPWCRASRSGVSAVADPADRGVDAIESGRARGDDISACESEGSDVVMIRTYVAPSRMSRPSRT